MRTVAAALMLVAVACGGPDPVGAPPTTAPPATSEPPPTTAPPTTVPPTASPPTTRPPTSRPPTTRPPATPPPTTRPPTTPPSAACPSPDAPPATVVRNGPTARRVVALTFDAGSDRGPTGEILDTLARYRAPASFGVTGDFARDNPDLVARIARAGHQLVNHSDRHWSFTGVSGTRVVLGRDARCTDLRRADAAIAAAAGGGTTRPWFRPPYGDYDASVLRDVAAAGYSRVAMWTVDSGGWRGVTPDEVTRRCLDGATPGAIYLFHVGAASTDAAALPDVLSGLRARGYTFVRLDRL